MTAVPSTVVLREAARWRSSTLLLAGISLAYVSARAVAFAGVVGTTPTVYPDTVDYEHVASLSLLDPAFWTYWKPWGASLVWKLLPGATATSAPVAQWLVATASWLVLAAAVAACLRHRVVRLAAVALLLAFSLAPLVVQWDGVLLSESLSTSFTVLLLTALLTLVRRPGRLTASAVALAAALATVTRDTNGYLAVLLVCPVALVLAFRGRRRLGAAVIAGVLATFAFSVWSYGVHRWETPMQGIVAERILTDADARAYFVAHGMPVRAGLGPALLAARVPPSRFDRAPELAYFRPWFERHARSTYARYLLTHPGASIGEPLQEFDLVVAPQRSLPLGLDDFRPAGLREVLPGPLVAVLYSQNGLVVTIEMALAAIAATALIRRRVHHWVALVALVGLASTIPLAIVIWNGDLLGLDRHALAVGLVARLSALLVLLAALDAVLLRGFPRYPRRARLDERAPID